MNHHDPPSAEKDTMLLTVVAPAAFPGDEGELYHHHLLS